MAATLDQLEMGVLNRKENDICIVLKNYDVLMVPQQSALRSEVDSGFS